MLRIISMDEEVSSSGIISINGCAMQCYEQEDLLRSM